MSKKQKRIRNELVKAFVDNTGTTGKRDTIANDIQDKYMAPDFYMGALYTPMSEDCKL